MKIAENIREKTLVTVEAALGGKHTDSREQIFADLLEYCKLDTLAMVEIFNVLRKL